MLKYFFMAYCLLLNSCVAIAQEELTFIDFTVATDRIDFTMPDFNNDAEYRSTDFDGSAFVIEFYFNGCTYCNQNAGNVKRLYEEFKENPKVQVIEITSDCQSWQHQDWLDRHDPQGPVLNGCNHNIFRRLGVSRFPTTIVFAPNKREAMRGTGVWSPANYQRIKNYLNQVSK
jgi:thioredoxin-related protein